MIPDILYDTPFICFCMFNWTYPDAMKTFDYSCLEKEHKHTRNDDKSDM